MWIFCTGGKRSGSTLQYNILSRIIEESNKGKRVTHFKIDEFDKIIKENANYKGYIVAKSHILTKEIKKELEKDNAIIFHSYRDLRDVVVSYINKGWIDNNEIEIKKCVYNYLKEYNQWKSLSKKVYSRKYEDFAFDIVEEIKFYLRVLNIDIDEKVILSISEELNINILKQQQDKIESNKIKSSYNQTFHEDTLLHSNHINDGSKNQFLKSLTKKQIVLIESLSYDFLFKNKYKLWWTDFKEFVSFSQHADDYIAWQLLGKKTKGLVVEVGAFDGQHLSNSKSLESIGWASINIEPSPEIFKFLKRNRPNSTNLNLAVVGDPSLREIEFFSEELGVLSGCLIDEEDLKRRYKNRGLKYEEPEKIKVKAKTLNQILQTYNSQGVDIMSIDVEGYELEVLKGLDLNKNEIKLLIIEANNKEIKDEIISFFKKYKKYIYIGSNYQNLFFAKTKTLSKKHIRQLDFSNYIKAKQVHPKGEAYHLDSRPSEFIKSQDLLKFEKYFGVF